MTFFRVLKRRVVYLFNIIPLFFYILKYQHAFPWSKGYSNLTKDARQVFAASFPTEFIWPVFLLKFFYRTDRSVFWLSLGSQSNRGNLENFVEYILPNIKHPFILILSDGDRCFVSDMNESALTSLLECQFLIKVYSQNVHNDFHPKISFIPIGLDLHTERSNSFGSNKFNLFLEKCHSKSDLKHTLVADCVARPTSELRKNFVLKNMSLDLKGTLKPVNLSEERLWDLYRSSISVLSLTGNGFDCHRTWEAYFLGCNVLCDSNFIRTPLSLFGMTVFEDFEEIDFGKLQRSSVHSRRSTWLSFLNIIQADLSAVQE